MLIIFNNKLFFSLLIILLIFVYLLPLKVMAKSAIINNKKIDESSGMALSRRYNDLLWTHNDSGSAAVIYAMSFKGDDLGTISLGGQYPRDWEDMSSFKYNGQAYLLLADSGDNLEINLTGRLSIYIEPDIKTPQDNIVAPQWEIKYQYPKSKSYDVESVAVDATQNIIILLSKRNKKVHVFELPLFINSNTENQHVTQQLLTAKRIAKLDYIKRPTSMDITEDGNYAAILTYGKVFWFDNRINNNWTKTLKTPAKIIKYKGLFQPEAISFGKTPFQLFISTEKLPAKLLELNVQDAKH